MSRFPSSGHLASWAGVSPGNRQSGGKRLSGKTRSGNAWLKAVLCEVVWANVRSQTSYLGAQLLGQTSEDFQGKSAANCGHNCGRQANTDRELRLIERPSAQINSDFRGAGGGI